MKTIFAPVLLALGSAIAAIAYLAVNSTLNASHACAAIASVFACGLILMAFSDYSYKPRFRLHRSRKATRCVPIPATSPQVDPACDWTYTTISA
jgi:hypothetical protein